MKKIIRYFCLMSLAFATFTSCENDSDNDSGVPELISVTTTTDFNTPLTSCNLGDWIVLHGKNLRNVSNIDINGVEINIRNSFLESEKITLQVPRALPEEGEPTNKIKITGAEKTSELSVSISIPKLIVNGLENEWAVTGDTVKILGANFDIYDVTKENGQVTFGNTDTDITETTADYVKVVIPNGAIKGDHIKIQSKNGTTPVPGLYRDDRNLFEGFEGGFGWAGTDNLVTDGTKAGDVAACNGKYLRIAKMHNGEWFAFIANGYVWPKEMWDHPEDWCLKFEVVTQKPINEKFIQFDQTKYQWKPWTTTEFNTYGKWRTITLEMTDVLLNGYTQDPNAGFLFQLSLNGGTNEMVDLGIDNFRLFYKK